MPDHHMAEQPDAQASRRPAEIPGLPPPGGARTLSRARTLELLADADLREQIDRTRLVPAGEEVDEDWLSRSARRNDTGLLVASGANLHIVIAPPFPLTSPGAVWAGPEFSAFEQHLRRDRIVAILLLRLGAYAVGVARDEVLVQSKTGRRYVHGRHRAGGQSQRRFQRNREKWMRELFDEACEVARQRFSEVDGTFDFLALGGDRHVLRQFMKRCPAVADLAPQLPGIVPVDRPRRDELEPACESIWSCHVYRAS